jgi:hypothetical protein
LPGATRGLRFADPVDTSAALTGAAKRSVTGWVIVTVLTYQIALLIADDKLATVTYGSLVTARRASIAAIGHPGIDGCVCNIARVNRADIGGVPVALHVGQVNHLLTKAILANTRSAVFAAFACPT